MKTLIQALSEAFGASLFIETGSALAPLVTEAFGKVYAIEADPKRYKAIQRKLRKHKHAVAKPGNPAEVLPEILGYKSLEGMRGLAVLWSEVGIAAEIDLASEAGLVILIPDAQRFMVHRRDLPAYDDLVAQFTRRVPHYVVRMVEGALVAAPAPEHEALGECLASYRAAEEAEADKPDEAEDEKEEGESED